MLDVCLHVVGYHLLLDDDVLVLARPEARRNQLLGLYNVCKLACFLKRTKLHKCVISFTDETYVVVHLIANLIEEALLFVLAVFSFICTMVHIT